MLKFPTLLDEDYHDILKWTYLSESRSIWRHNERLVTYAKKKWHTFDTADIKRLKVMGWLKITRTHSRTGRSTKMLPRDLSVDELCLTSLGLALAQTCVELEDVYYVIENGELVYGTLADFGYLKIDFFSMQVGKTRRHLLAQMAQGTRLRIKPNATKANPNALGLFATGDKFIGTFRGNDIQDWWLEYAKFRPQQLAVEVTRVSSDSVAGHVVVMTINRKSKALPDDGGEHAVKAALDLI